MHACNALLSAWGSVETGAALRAVWTAFIQMLRERGAAFPLAQMPLWFHHVVSISQSKWFL